VSLAQRRHRGGLPGRGVAADRSRSGRRWEMAMFVATVVLSGLLAGVTAVLRAVTA
jgi:hypothetical protein